MLQHAHGRGKGLHKLCNHIRMLRPNATAMPRVVVDVDEKAYLWLQSQQGQWKPRSAVLREIINEAIKRQQQESQTQQCPIH
jgi:hypothetical protein